MFSLQYSGKTNNRLNCVDQFKTPQLNITEGKGPIQRVQIETLRTQHPSKFVHTLGMQKDCWSLSHKTYFFSGLFGKRESHPVCHWRCWGRLLKTVPAGFLSEMRKCLCVSEQTVLLGKTPLFTLKTAAENATASAHSWYKTSIMISQKQPGRNYAGTQAHTYPYLCQYLSLQRAPGLVQTNLTSQQHW